LLLTEPPQKLLDAPQRSPEWFSYRSGRLTASYFGAALGLSPYMSRQALFRELTGRAEPFAGNVMTDWGNAHEAEAISCYEEQTGNIVLPASFVRLEEWSGCTPDGYVADDGLIEVKCPYTQKLYQEWPDHYRAQVIGQLAITGRKWCDCWCWTPQEARVVERIEYQQGEWSNILVALTTFWRYVIEDIQPPKQAKFKFKEK
jgi:putative phage-type endonuclease